MPDLGSNQYGPFLIMQYGGGLLVLIGLAFAIYPGTRDRKLSADQESSPGMARWYFDGPLKAALDTMRDTYRVMSSIDGQVDTFGELFRNQTRELQEIKAEIHELKNIMARRR